MHVCASKIFPSSFQQQVAGGSGSQLTHVAQTKSKTKRLKQNCNEHTFSYDSWICVRCFCRHYRMPENSTSKATEPFLKTNFSTGLSII